MARDRNTPTWLGARLLGLPSRGSRRRDRDRNPLWALRRILFQFAVIVILGCGVAILTSDLPPDGRESAPALTSYLCTAEVTSGCGPDNAVASFAEAGQDRRPTTFDQLPDHLIDAIVATEDQSFFTHSGADLRGIARASYRLARGDAIRQGGSTITQQYIKLSFDDQDRSAGRKVRELLRALRFEKATRADCRRLLLDSEGSAGPDGEVTGREVRRCAKRRILVDYLNRAHFGRGASGVDAAARAYFGVSVAELSLSQSAFLAGLLRNPWGADPDRDLDEALRRRDTTLDLMVGSGLLTAEAGAAAATEPLTTLPPPARAGSGEVKDARYGTEYFVEEVRIQVDHLFADDRLHGGGLRVYTTLDRELQRAAYQAVHEPSAENLEARGLPQLGPAHLDPEDPDEPDAALVSIDRHGRVIAMVAGTDFEQSQYNLVTGRGGWGRQPGAILNTVGLAVAIEEGIDPYEIIDQVAARSPGGVCAHPGRGRRRGLFEALVQSDNTAFVRLMGQVGQQQIGDAARRMGLTGLDDPVAHDDPCALVLGRTPAQVIDVANVYSTFARSGVRVDPVVIERIEDAEGNVICWYPVSGRCTEDGERTGDRVVTPEVAVTVNAALAEVVERGSGEAAWFRSSGPVAGKTGTSPSNRDGWFAGFACELTTVVWVGHDDDRPAPMLDFRRPKLDGTTGYDTDENGVPVNDPDWPNLEGGNIPAWMWRAYMAQAAASPAGCD